MKIFSLIVLSFVLIGCNSETNKNLDNLTVIKNNFINSIFDSYIDEGPFQMHYHLRTILFSDNVVSLLGEVFVYDHLPHGWSKFESKTYVKKSGTFKEITLNDLFKTDTQREYLRKTCEDALKKEKISYFSGEQPLRTILNLEDIQNFVVDDKYLIVIFQPYIVGSGADDPFIVKIPFTELIGKWQTGNPLERQLPINKNFISSWEKDNWIYDVQDDHSIAYQKET